MSAPPSYAQAVRYEEVTKEPSTIVVQPSATVVTQPLAKRNTCHLPNCPYCTCPKCKTNNLVLESETDWCVYRCGSPCCCDPWKVIKRCKHCGYEENAQGPPDESYYEVSNQLLLGGMIQPLPKENTCHLPVCPYCKCPSCGTNNVTQETETDWCVVCCGNPYCCDPYTVMKRCKRCGYQQNITHEQAV